MRESCNKGDNTGFKNDFCTTSLYSLLCGGTYTSFMKMGVKKAWANSANEDLIGGKVFHKSGYPLTA